jgi:Domain of unknown function (DUF4145)
MKTKIEKLAVLAEAIEHSADAVKAFCSSYPQQQNAELIKNLAPENVNPEQRAALSRALFHLSDVAIYCKTTLSKPLHLHEESLVNNLPRESKLAYDKQIRDFVMPMYELAIRIVDLQCRLHHSKVCEFSSIVDAGVEISKSQLQEFFADRITFKSLLVERNSLTFCVKSLHNFGFVGSKLLAAPEIKSEVLASVKQKIITLRLSKSDERNIISEANQRATAMVSSYKFDSGDLLLSLDILLTLGTPVSESAQKLDKARDWLIEATSNYSALSLDGLAAASELDEASAGSGRELLFELSDETNEFLDGEDAARELLDDNDTWKYLKLTSRTTLGDYVKRFEMIVEPLNISNPSSINAEDRETYIELCHVVTGGHWRAAYALSRAFLERLLKKHEGWEGKSLKKQLCSIKEIDSVIKEMFPSLLLIVERGNNAVHDNINPKGATNVDYDSLQRELKDIVPILLRLAQHVGTKDGSIK